MRGWVKSGIAAAMLMLAATPATAQSNASEGEAFLKAIEEKDGGKAVPMLDNPASRVVNYRGYKGETALHIATRNRESDWVGLLINKGANPNIGDAKGDTPLIIAARIGYEEAATWMLQRRAQVDLANRRGETALIIAVQQRQRRLVELLLRAGANPDKADHSAGYSARDYAKRDTRSRELLKLIETVKSTKTKVAGPKIN